jgi:hypothetical protein
MFSGIVWSKTAIRFVLRQATSRQVYGMQMPLNAYKGKMIELSFELSPEDYLPGATLVFSMKRSRREGDSVAILKSAANGLLYDSMTGLGLIIFNPAETATLQPGVFECDLQMTLGTAVYVLGEMQLRLSVPVFQGVLNV